MSDVLVFKWSVSRGRDTYGYNICSLWVNGKKVAACNGGNYDMMGTCLGHFIDNAYADRLRELDKPFYGLSFHDPHYDPGKAIIDGETVEQREKDGKSLGLERYQQHYSASSPLPTERHTVPEIHWGIGIDSVRCIGNAIGLHTTFVNRTSKESTYLLEDTYGR